MQSDRNVRAGLCLVPEGRGVFASMSVLDNLLLGAHHNMRNVARNLERVYEWFPILRTRRDQVARTLSGGERQMLAIGRALMSAPKLIMIDEPSIGLAPIVVNDIFAILTRLNHEGYTILLSEQNAFKALKCAHRGYVLETGSVTLAGSAEQLSERSRRQGRVPGSIGCRIHCTDHQRALRWAASTSFSSRDSTSFSGGDDHPLFDQQDERNQVHTVHITIATYCCR